jgi:DNA-binding HxlR family transcriptional regulator
MPAMNPATNEQHGSAGRVEQADQHARDDQPACEDRDDRLARPDRLDHADDSCERLLVDCQLRAGTELLAHTWDPVVLAALHPGPLRRSQLLAMTGGISDKVLTQTLRRLLANGLITRHPIPSAPPRVDYALTPLGSSLVAGPLHALATWTLAHAEALLEAQDQPPR